VYNPPGIMLANLRALFGVVVDIVLLRRGPEHLPASTALLLVAIALNLAVSAVLVAFAPKSPPTWPLQLIVGTLILLLWFRASFEVAQKRERFVQTMTAYILASTVFMPALVPLAAALQPFMADPENVKQPPAMVLIPAVVVLVWMVAVQARIVRAAFEWPWLLSIVFILAQNFVSAFLLALMFGTPRPEA
jgi:hypothetical protein